MSTIKSSAENLTLNADGANNDVIIQSNGSTKVHIDSTGKVGIGVTSIGTNDAVHIENGESYLVMKDAQQMGIKLYGDDTNVIFSYDKTADSITGGVTWAHADGATDFYTGGLNSRIKINATGAVTMPAQPAFSATKSSAQNDIAINSLVTITVDGERFDQNSDFDLTNNRFTAPVTGKYQINIITTLANLDQDATYIEVKLVTSNVTYTNPYIDPEGFDKDIAFYTISASYLVDMDANDTALMAIYIPDGAAQTDVRAGQTSFSGYLAC